MNAMRLLVVSVIFLSCSICSLAQDKKATPVSSKMLVGKWQITKAEEEPVGAVIEFAKDGKMKVVYKKNGKEVIREGTYKVEGDKLLIALKIGDKVENKDPATIKSLSDTEMVLAVQRDEIVEFKRIK